MFSAVQRAYFPKCYFAALLTSAICFVCIMFQHILFAFECCMLKLASDINRDVFRQMAFSVYASVLNLILIVELFRK